VELFNPSFQTQAGGVQDLCGSDVTDPKGSHLTAAQCANTNGGVPLVNYGTSNLDCPADQCQVLLGGNVALKPEAANTLTIGLVLTPTFFDGFSATIDYYDIKVNHIISNLDFTSVFTSCATSGAAASCSLIHRGPGEILFGGTGSGFIDTRTLNLGFTEVEGVDVEANYSSDLDDLGFGPNGAIAANFVGTYSANAFTEQVLGDPGSDIQCNGRFGGSQCNRPQPFWRHKLRVTWTSPFAFNLSAQWRLVGSVKEVLGGTAGVADSKLPTISYFDLAGTYDVFDNLQLRAGVNNVLDQDPPIVGSEIRGAVFGNGNTYPGQYDALGRTFFVGGTVHY
jgi:outer membrane receptor protein involved in Fe transport